MIIFTILSIIRLLPRRFIVLPPPPHPPTFPAPPFGPCAPRASNFARTAQHRRRKRAHGTRMAPQQCRKLSRRGWCRVGKVREADKKQHKSRKVMRMLALLVTKKEEILEISIISGSKTIKIGDFGIFSITADREPQSESTQRQEDRSALYEDEVDEPAASRKRRGTVIMHTVAFVGIFREKFSTQIVSLGGSGNFCLE